MFWADEFLKNIKGPQHVNDSWTPSGIVHMGSLKGPVIHDVLFKILKEKNTSIKFTYGFDDADPLDGLPPDLKNLSEYMGMPLWMTPAPDGNGTFAEYFIRKMKSHLDALGIKAENYRTSDLYKNGTFNKAIQIVLDNAQEVRKVYGKMYKKEIPKDWFPFQVICPKCKKIGTSKVTAWDGKEVSYFCSPDLVDWAKGCGKKGKMSPFNGTGKMSWKVEWAAKWWTFPVTIEAAGKDHGSAGGSYDLTTEIVKNVFKSKPPKKLVYEFFLSGGRKMSSSKGVGVNAQELIEVMGPQRSRFLNLKSPPNQTVEFTPYYTDSIPKVFDEYQKVAKKEDEKNTRLFIFSQIGKEEKVPQVRFSVLAQWIQMPNMEEEIKKQGLEEWAKYARIWIEKYAPEEEKFTVKEELPEGALHLSGLQRTFLTKVTEELDEKWEAEKFQEQLYEWAKELDLSSKDAFAAIYTALIGKDHGPKAAWLILSLEKEFVQRRFREV